MGPTPVWVRNSPFILGKLEEGFTETYLNNKCKKEKNKLNRSLRQIGERLGLSVQLTLSEARNAYANTLKKAGVNLSVIAEQLGHSSVDTSEKWYLSSFDKDTLRKAHDAVY